MKTLLFWTGFLAALAVFVMLALTVPLPATGASRGADVAEKMFPRDRMISIRLFLSDADKAEMLRAGQEQRYRADLVYDGHRLPNVALRIKGNSSLFSIRGSGSQRYSFKVYLDEYVPGQSLAGVTTINLNNHFSDPTYMREYLSYEAFRSLGVPTPDTAYANLYINDELWGLYLAVEHVNLSYLARRYAHPRGDLYKPEGLGANLGWLGDDIQNYPGMGYESKGRSTNHRPLLQMLDALNHGGDLERHLDVPEVLRYLAVSTVLANFDSYQGAFQHNYYLYEQDGRFQILPWDLNMSFAGFDMAGTREQMVGVWIDEPTMGPLADRPLIARLLQVPEYRELYHGYIRALITGYLEPQRFARRVAEVAAVIGPHVQADPTALFSYEEHVRSLREDIEPSRPALPGAPAGGPPGGPPGPAWGPPPGGPGIGLPPPMRGFPGRPPGSMPGQPGGPPPGPRRAVGLVPFVQDRVANVWQQLEGAIPASGDGSGLGMGRMMPPGALGQPPGFPPLPPPGAEGAPPGFPPPPGFQPQPSFAAKGMAPKGMAPKGMAPRGMAPKGMAAPPGPPGPPPAAGGQLLRGWGLPLPQIGGGLLALGVVTTGLWWLRPRRR